MATRYKDLLNGVEVEIRLDEAFNEWMRRYTEEPERFSREWQTVGRFLREQAAGEVPTYGERCAAYLEQLTREAQVTKPPAPLKGPE